MIKIKEINKKEIIIEMIKKINIKMINKEIKLQNNVMITNYLENAKKMIIVNLIIVVGHN